MSILVWAEHENGALRTSALSAIAAATRLGDVSVVLLGRDTSAAAASVATVRGVKEVVCASASQPLDESPDQLAQALVQLVRRMDATHLFAAATPLARGVLPRASAELDVMQISEVVRIDAPDTFARLVYAGSALVTVRSSDAVKVATVRVTSFPASEETAAAAPVSQLELDVGQPLCECIAREEKQRDQVELAGARIVVSGGRGMGSAEQFSILEPLASRLGAAVGASRAAVDAGYARPDQQVGQTGKIVAPELYIAVGISGAVQHLAGMKDSRVIVAINKDPEAPIFQVADYGIVGDLFDVIPALEKAL